MARIARRERRAPGARLISRRRAAVERAPAHIAAIERATPEDIAAIVALDVPLAARERQDAIVRASTLAGTCLVARDGATIAGYLTWDRSFFGRPFVWLLAVAPAYRRRGLGRALLAVAERDATHFGELFISTEQINAPMHALLVSMTYVTSGAIDNINARGNLETVYYKRLAVGTKST